MKPKKFTSTDKRAAIFRLPREFTIIQTAVNLCKNLIDRYPHWFSPPFLVRAGVSRIFLLPLSSSMSVTIFICLAGVALLTFRVSIGKVIPKACRLQAMHFNVLRLDLIFILWSLRMTRLNSCMEPISAELNPPHTLMAVQVVSIREAWCITRYAQVVLLTIQPDFQLPISPLP